MFRPLALLMPLALAACSAEPPASANATGAAMPIGSLGGVAPVENGAVASTRGVPTTAPTHLAPALQALVNEDFEDKELVGSGCTFNAGPGGPKLLGVRDEGDGLVRYDKRLHRITAATPGRDAIEGGGILAGNGVSFAVTRQPGDPVEHKPEFRAWPATLTMRTADGGERVYRDGRWECGS